MANPSQHIEQYPTYTPVDWGIGVVACHWRMLFLLGMPVFAAELIAGYVLYIAPMTPKVMFGVATLLNLAHAWLLTALLMFLITRMRQERLSLSALSYRALAYLPKVFISYSLFSMLVSVGIRVPPALVMLFFFMWAPAFCAAETYALKPEDDSVIDDDEDFDEDDFERDVHYQRRSFIGIAPWDLGAARSMQMVSQHLMPCLQVFVLFWAAVVVPLALVYFVVPQPFGLMGQLLQFALSAICSVVAVAVWSGAYLSLLSEGSFEELGLAPENFHSEILDGRSPRPIATTHPGLFVAVAIVALAASLYYAQMSHQLEVQPVTAVFETERVRREGDTLVVKLRLTDSERQYRWLELEEFRAVFDSKRIPRLVTFGDGEAKSQQEAVQPVVDRSLIYTDSGKLLHPSFFKPHYGEMQIVLRFPISEESLKMKRVFLYYGNSTEHGVDEPFYQGALPADEY